MFGRNRVRAVVAALAVVLAAAGVGASTASGAPAELIGAPRQVYANGGETYLVDASRGTVQWLDRESMAPRGVLVDLGGPIGRPVVDPEGVLWATVGDSGSVTGMFRDQPARPVRVSGEGQTLQLALVTGRLIAFDTSEWTISQINRGGVASKYEIPEENRDLVSPRMLMPAWTESSLLPMLGKGLLIVVDVDQKWTWSGTNRLEESALAEPHSFGRSVVITHGTEGLLQRIDFKQPKTASTPDEPAELKGAKGYRTVVVRNGGLFVDEAHNPKPR
jgi:hypothetical protein